MRATHGYLLDPGPDGVEYLDTIATEWGGLHVLVMISDRRRRFSFLWLHCDDVGRR